MIEFMLNIRLNNHKEFMHAHKDEYQRKMRAPYYALIEVLSPLMLQIDPQMEVRPAKCLSRIYRDTRFSRDKSPYRDHHWIAFRHAGEPRESAVMFWFELRIESMSWGLGFWGENRSAMDILRRRMVSHPHDLLELLPILGKHLVISGDSYKRLVPPEGIHPLLRPLYPMKDFYISRTGIDYNWAFSSTLYQKLVADYQTMAPFYRLLRGYYQISMLGGDSFEPL